MRRLITIVLLGVLAMAGCSKDEAQNLLDTAQTEMKQNKLEHAIDLYWQVLQKYPNSKYSKIANKQLIEISKKPEAAEMPVLFGR